MYASALDSPADESLGAIIWIVFSGQHEHHVPLHCSLGDQTVACLLTSLGGACSQELRVRYSLDDQAQMRSNRRVGRHLRK